MEERMTEEFILEEDDSEESSSRRPFQVAVGALLVIGVLAVACTGITLFLRGSAAERDGQVSEIETRNAIVAITNEAVTQTIAAMQTEEARPTDTPELTPTNTATPIATDTQVPTNTPVVQQAEDEGAATPSLFGTSAFAAGAGDATPTPLGALGNGSSDGTLPQTGVSTWGATVAALLFIGIFAVARRLRSN